MVAALAMAAAEVRARAEAARAAVDSVGEGSAEEVVAAWEEVVAAREVAGAEVAVVEAVVETARETWAEGTVATGGDGGHQAEMVATR